MLELWGHRLGQGLVLVLITLTTVGGCNPVSVLEHAESSPELLTVAVLEALEKRDEARLRQLALSEREFREIVWPELPAAKPERNLPFSLVWSDLRVKSDAALAGTLQEYGGRKLVLSDIWFRAGTEQYQSYIVYRIPTLRVIDEAGIDHEIRLFGSILERGGRFKVFSYIID